jgi:hypothetical protein
MLLTIHETWVEIALSFFTTAAPLSGVGQQRRQINGALILPRLILGPRRPLHCKERQANLQRANKGQLLYITNYI